MFKRGSAYYWTAAEDRLLGKQPDAEVARLVGRTQLSVRKKRHKLELLAFGRTSRRSGGVSRAARGVAGTELR